MAVAGALAVLAGCGDDGEASPEGNRVEVNGVHYHVPLARQLNPNIAPDDAYWRRDEPEGSRVLLGVFLEGCNETDRARRTAAEFSLSDHLGHTYRPEQPRQSNPFAYEAQQLDPDECFPAPGSVADTAASGKLLFFEIPLEAMRNRPLTLAIAPERAGSAKIELDL